MYQAVPQLEAGQLVVGRHPLVLTEGLLAVASPRSESRALHPPPSGPGRPDHLRPMPQAIVTAFLVGLLSVSCAPLMPASRQPTADVVRFAWEDVGAPTPFRVSTAGPGGVVMLNLLYDTLTWKDEHGIIPWLAQSWEVSADGRDYTFTLAPGVTWHDGEKLDATDVAFSFAYYAEHPFRWTATSAVESATALATDRVQVRLRRPYAPFLEEIAGSVPILPEHIWSRVEAPETYAGPGASIGSGPFKLAEYRSSEGAYRLTANTSYFKGPVTIREFQQLNISPESRVQALQRGEIDLAWSTDASVEDLFKGDPRVKVLETPPLSIVRLAVNTERAPLDSKQVRQAVAYAVDRSTLAQTLTRTSPIVASAGVIPPDSPWFTAGLPTYAFDVHAAASLLRGRSYTLELLALPTYREPELLEPMLRAVGITLVTRRVDDKTRTQLLRERNFQLALLQHVGVSGDPDYLRRWSADQETNDAAQGFVWRDAAYSQLVNAQAETLDPAQRRALVAQLQVRLADELPTIPLYMRRFYWLYNSSAYTPMNTFGGLMNGIPFGQNKLTFLRR